MQTKGHDGHEHRGRVYLELATGSDAEVARGLAVLRAVVDDAATAGTMILAGA